MASLLDGQVKARPGPVNVNARPTRNEILMEEKSVHEHFELGNRHSDRKEWGQAISEYEKVLAHEPGHEWALNNLGFCLIKAGKAERAVEHLQKAVLQNAGNAMANANLALALAQSGRKYDALPYRRRLIEIQPENADVHLDLANLLLGMGRADESLAIYRKAIELSPQNSTAVSNMLLATNYSDSLSVEEIAKLHFRYAKSTPFQRRARDEWKCNRSLDRCLRIGYVSTDFSVHPVGKLMRGIVRSHDAAQYEIYCYSDSNKQDQVTDAIRECVSSFRVSATMDDESLTDAIRNDQIDILIELNGHSGGRNRLGVMARGAAPVQASFLGYPNTTGSPAVDYLITDEWCDPSGKTERYHTERLLRLQRGFLCYEPPKELPGLMPAPCLLADGVTFGSFNNPSKISNSTLQTWAAILRATPQSKLVVKYGRSFTSERLKDRWTDILSTNGVDPSCIEYLGAAPTLVDHLKTIGSVDLCLDAFPYQGTMTTLETLSMGVPVVTLAGETYCRRASSALLLRLGFSDLVATSKKDYQEKAIAISRETSQLAAMREHIRQKFLRSTICDVPGFTSELESGYRTMWHQWCTGAVMPNSHASSVSRKISTGVHDDLQTDTVIISGMPKSGFECVLDIVSALYESEETRKRLVAGYLAECSNSASRLKEAINAGAEGDDVTLIGTPVLSQEEIEFVLKTGTKCIYTHRDPLDCVAALNDVRTASVGDLVDSVEECLDVYTRLTVCDNALLVNFDDLVGNLSDVTSTIVDFLNFSVSVESVNRIAKRYQIKTKQIDSPVKFNEPVMREGSSLLELHDLEYSGEPPRSGRRDLGQAFSSSELELLSNSFSQIQDHPGPEEHSPAGEPDLSGLGPFKYIRSIWDRIGQKELVILDIGAHHGQTTAVLHELFPTGTIFSFEPFPNAFRQLNERSAAMSRVHPVPVAVSDSPGQRTLFVNGLDVTNSLYPRPATSTGRRYFPRRANQRSESKVDVTTIDAFAKNRDLDHVDILKMDIQGGELSALRGAEQTLRHRNVSFILVEAMFVSHYSGTPLFNEVWQFLERFGFSLLNLYGLRRAKNGQLRKGDALFVSSRVRTEVVDNLPAEP